MPVYWSSWSFYYWTQIAQINTNNLCWARFQANSRKRLTNRTNVGHVTCDLFNFRELIKTKTIKTISMISILLRITVCCWWYLIENKSSSFIPTIKLGISCLEIIERKNTAYAKKQFNDQKGLFFLDPVKASAGFYGFSFQVLKS